MMRRLLAGFALLVCVLPLAAQSARESYEALAKRYEDALVEYKKAFEAARTDEQRDAVIRDKHPAVGEYATKFMGLARRNPDTDVAVDSLIWVVNHPLPPTTAESVLRGSALEKLGQNHADSDKVGSLCTGVVRGVDSATDAFLRTVRTKAKRLPVKARATVSLALNLRHRARLLAVIVKDKEAQKQYETLLGKAAMSHLLEQDPKKLQAECEKLFEEARDRYEAVEHPTHGNFELFARRQLLAIRKPVVVDSEAPPLSGEDLEGKRLSLSLLKGKVVLIDFWNHTYAPCRAMYAYERGLVERLDGKPFALIGVNGDFDRESVKKTVKSEKLTWRTFHDAGTTSGPIATRWDVEVWPTVILIDHKGIVKHRWVGWPETKKLDKLIDDLVREAK